ncbi:helix-turn-helix domain-containing protein [Macrococcoides canis]|uniref:helix-turn-helix domain-containing protein n=1 Tax=Macrococcoides canis TaxID=1855823 RepID=UPI001642CF6B|nr:XRE family transcriptional regulator [Macrococcus canis]QTQ07823.1 helix-turn-helix transcriptional regulator [Macrococcus canis]UTG99807.1 helix-turn-helix transcriptional regulator [Macrococcus canis]UTH02125.1 helix-turn-helix transcriptional regulator [Macrococcus canis]UTH11274.1 helix-turn-helix transcriptional regulator [Macrococcus canis]WBF53203.1 XRE family transcriptional regulator [Macrococcus canis]
MFGNNVKKLRLEKGDSLETLALKSNVSRSMLSKIERNEKQPTLKVAAQIAEALNTTISYLLDETVQENTKLIPEGKHLTYTDPSSGFVRKLLSPNTNSSIEFVHNTIPPYTTSGIFPPHNKGVKEYIYILSGMVEVSLNQSSSYKLSKGDSFYFEAHVSHEFMNKSDDNCEYILIIDSKG